MKSSIDHEAFTELDGELRLGGVPCDRWFLPSFHDSQKGSQMSLVAA